MNAVERLVVAGLTANLRALRFLARPDVLADYLRSVNRLYLERTLAPIRPVDLAGFLGDTPVDSDLFAPVDAIAAGSSSLADVVALAAMTRHLRPRRVIEIGTFEGLTASVFARNAPPGARVFTLDLPQPGDQGLTRTERSFAATSIPFSYQSGRLLPVFGCAGRVECLRGDSAVFDFAPYGPADLFFIDGAHTKDYVAGDTLSAIRALSPEGWVIWHDAMVPDVLAVLRLVAAVHPVYFIRETSLAVCISPPPLAPLQPVLEPLTPVYNSRTAS